MAQDPLTEPLGTQDGWLGIDSAESAESWLLPSNAEGEPDFFDQIMWDPFP